MKAIIELQERGLTSIKFLEKGKKNIQWNDLTKEEQEIFVESLKSFERLFNRCIKTE